MTNVDLAQIGSSALYAPASGGRFVFLRWDGANPPASIQLAATWASSGPPAAEGWHVLVTAPPSAAAAAAFESSLRGVLAASRGFAWAITPPATFALAGQVPIGLDLAGKPIVASDSPIALPRGITQLTFSGGLALTAVDPPDLTGISAAAPAGNPGPGIVVALAGDAPGCVRLRGLLYSTVVGDRSRKDLAEVQLDPLAPFDPDRTKITPLGLEYELIHDAGGYLLKDAGA